MISSDFCHWGPSFDYSPHDKSKGSISKSIEAMDKEGMSHIEDQNGEAFNAYLKKTSNTICGRHPIGVWLAALKEAGLTSTTKFVKYAQSSEIKSKHDTQVSYASSYTVV